MLAQMFFSYIIGFSVEDSVSASDVSEFEREGYDLEETGGGGRIYGYIVECLKSDLDSSFETELERI
jgi:hypothetical protein